MQVDEEDGADAGSEDDFELGDMAGAAAAGDAEDSGAGAGAAAGAASSKRQKSVRMDVAGVLTLSCLAGDGECEGQGRMARRDEQQQLLLLGIHINMAPACSAVFMPACCQTSLLLFHCGHLVSCWCIMHACRG